MVQSSESSLIVVARSAALIPVVIPLAASTETVKLVLKDSLLLGTIIGSSSLVAIDSEIGVQIRPLPYLAIKLTISGVIHSAEAIRSPSFSLSASSVMMTILPAFISVMISSIGLNGGSLFMLL